MLSDVLLHGVWCSRASGCRPPTSMHVHHCLAMPTQAALLLLFFSHPSSCILCCSTWWDPCCSCCFLSPVTDPTKSFCTCGRNAKRFELRILCLLICQPGAYVLNMMMTARTFSYPQTARPHLVVSAKLGRPEPQRQPDPFDRHSSPRDKQEAARKLTVSRSQKGKAFDTSKRRRGRPAHLRSPHDTPLRDGNRGEHLREPWLAAPWILTCAMLNLVLYCSSTLQIDSWAF